jgi:hypothetical protein
MDHKCMHFRWTLVLSCAVLLSACAGAPSLPTTTPTTTATNTPEPTSTSTSTPTVTPSPTVTPDVAATQQYTDFVSIVQQYYEAGQISTTEGEYVVLDDYEAENASKLSYAWTETGVVARNFIVRANFAWSNAIDTVNTSGCGFMFRLQPNQDHYIVILDAYSGVKLASHTDRGTVSMGSPQNGEQTLSDFGSGPYQATFTLIVNELRAYVYVNDIYFGEYKLLEHRITDAGPLANAILSAASQGYGTRCKMTNVHAWIFDP